MTTTRQLPLNLSGSEQGALPLLSEERAHAELLALARADAAPPVLPKTRPARDVVRRVAVPPETAPYVAKSATSKAAAESLSEEALDKQRRLVLDYLRHRGGDGCCDWEIAAAHPLEMASSLRRARVVLMDGGYVKDSGERRVNPGSGKRCVVWVAADQQRQAPEAAA